MTDQGGLTAQMEAVKAQIEAVTKENGDIKLEFTTLAITPLTDSKWTAFASKVEAASSKIDEVIKLLEEYNLLKASTSKAVKEDPNAIIFKEYAELYTMIKGSLTEQDGSIKIDLDASNFEKLIFTENFIRQNQGSNVEGNPINNFILAIKNYSLNSNANTIRPNDAITQDKYPELNHQLLRAVLDALDLTSIKGLLPDMDTSYDTMGNLIEAITALFKNKEGKLQPKILELYNKFASSQGGGSSSSSVSKKNRKSHKYYHPDIGKTKKHHHGHHKKISFVH